MTRAQYQYLRDTQRRLQDAHKKACGALTVQDWERNHPGTQEAQALYEQLRAVTWRLEVAECRDMEFSEDWEGTCWLPFITINLPPPGHVKLDTIFETAAIYEARPVRFDEPNRYRLVLSLPEPGMVWRRA